METHHPATPPVPRHLRLGILATHPVQYHAPLFRGLASRPGVDLTVFFCHRPTPREQGAGFGVDFQWDVDLTSGYRHVWLHNRARHPSVAIGHFRGCDTPEIADYIRGRIPVGEGEGDAQGTGSSPVALGQPTWGRAFDLFVVHGWAWKSCWQAFRACWRSGTPLAVRGDSQLPQGRLDLCQRLREAAKRLLYPLFIRRFDVCLAYGQRSAEYFRHYGARRVVIAPHFVDNAWFAARAAEARTRRAELRRHWSIPEHAFCFLFCGKFEVKKRPMDLLQALERLHGSRFDNASSARPGAVPETSTLPAVHLLMVGDGAIRSECETYANEHGLPVTFAGFVNQSRVPEAYAVGDCLVLCSDGRETWGLVVNEAMACGLPAVVSAACGCAPDLVAPEIASYTFPPGCVDDLATAMCTIALAPRETRRGAIEAHVSKHSPDEAANRILEAAGV